MSDTKPTPERQLDFVKHLQRLLADGSFVASYKYALLSAIADLAVKKGSDTNDVLRLTTFEIAEEFVALYWDQALPFGGSSGGTSDQQSGQILRQNTGSEAAIIRLIRVARTGGTTIAEVKSKASTWIRLVKAVEQVVKIQPLWKLQTVGTERLNCIYENLDAGSEIVLKPGVAYCFRAFHGLITELVRSSWLSFVRRLNTKEVDDSNDLAAFMFGTERASLSRHAEILREFQRGCCFYCESQIKGAGEVDHFIPWSRYPFDLGHNFVLAHSGCNGDKSNFLAGIRHLEKWFERNATDGARLAKDFDDSRIAHNLESSLGITSWAYAQAESVGSQLWVESKANLVPFDSNWRRLLSQFS